MERGIFWMFFLFGPALSFDYFPKDFPVPMSFRDELLREILQNRADPEPMNGDYFDESSSRMEMAPPLAVARGFGSVAGNPMTRDREYLEHSPLWGHQYMQGEASRLFTSIHGFLLSTEEKSEDGCLEVFENTAGFSREYQAAQECLCDSEHMFSCPESSNGNSLDDEELDRLLRDYHIEGQHKSLVAKKFHVKKDHKVKRSYNEMENIAKELGKLHSSSITRNPFLEGPKLPVLAKKGTKLH
ncbi:unnamed protein product [Darwinula stevensoni]|uniref:Neuroendocrine protein 7B2 n=1 Tax=Darwinula stevensoni TaxID=69355 RepID=A0A7R8WYU9_9CRUS|nr:unnamed protein product [Darwinula stevensoni]CAG0879363.1 unnamed protein product [Darwinula stevensoni]